MLAAVLWESSAGRSLSIPLFCNELPPRVTKTVAKDRLLGKSSNKSLASPRQMQRRTALRTWLFNNVDEVLMTMREKRIHSSANQEVQNGWTIPHYSQTWIQASRNDGTVWECVQMGSAVCLAFVDDSKLCFSENVRCAMWTYCIVYGQALASWNVNPVLEKFLQTTITFAGYINTDLSKQGCLLGYLRLCLRN
jgi:hypothetical protein